MSLFDLHACDVHWNPSHAKPRTEERQKQSWAAHRREWQVVVPSPAAGLVCLASGAQDLHTSGQVGQVLHQGWGQPPAARSCGHLGRCAWCLLMSPASRCSMELPDWALQSGTSAPRSGQQVAVAGRAEAFGPLGPEDAVQQYSQGHLRQVLWQCREQPHIASCGVLGRCAWSHGASCSENHFQPSIRAERLPGWALQSATCP